MEPSRLKMYFLIVYCPKDRELNFIKSSLQNNNILYLCVCSCILNDTTAQTFGDTNTGFVHDKFRVKITLWPIFDVFVGENLRIGHSDAAPGTG